jgi:hypothetical protein
MKSAAKYLSTRTTGKRILYGMALSAFLVSAPIFGDEQQVLDELYNEIIGASVKDHGTIDSGSSKSAPVDRFKVNPVVDPGSEKLRQEIEKMIEEAKQRHSDAVRFMQESK